VVAQRKLGLSGLMGRGEPDTSGAKDAQHGRWVVVFRSAVDGRWGRQPARDAQEQASRTSSSRDRARRGGRQRHRSTLAF
jgi:hypothetical protein